MDVTAIDATTPAGWRPIVTWLIPFATREQASDFLANGTPDWLRNLVGAHMRAFEEAILGGGK